MEAPSGAFHVFVRVYINGLRRWYDQNTRLKFILRNEFKIFNYEIKRKIISEVRIMDRIALVTVILIIQM